MIEPPRKGEPYPGRLPPLWEQWRQVAFAARALLVGVPAALVAVLFAVSVTVAATLAVLLVGAAAATVTYAKNRSDRHNAALDRGEIPAAPDPHVRAAGAGDLDAALVQRLESLGYPRASLGRVARFDGGWLVKRRSRAEAAVVLGDDGGHAFFDPRWVTDFWAAGEYLAGRGRDPD